MADEYHWDDNPFARIFGVGQLGRRQRLANETALERAEIAAGPGHASVAENRRQFETQQRMLADAQGAWVSILNQEMGGPEGTPTPEITSRALRRFIATPQAIGMGQALVPFVNAIRSGQPQAGDAFSLTPGQRRYGPDGRLIAENPTAVPRPYESSTDRTRTEMLQGLHTSGQSAETALQELTALADPLLRVGQTYPQGTWSGMAARLGLPVQGRTDLQVISSILDGLTPLQRRGLPGAASDRDMATFKGRLPDLLRTAEGNQEILTFLMAQARSQALAGAVAREAFTRRDADPAEVFGRASSIRFADVLAETRREVEARSDAIVQRATGVDVAAIREMTDEQLRTFTAEMARRPGGIPPAIMRRIRARAQRIDADLGQ